MLADLVKISLRQIYRNRRRYRGAILGTALGIAGLITVVSMGESVESMIGKNLEILGSATIVKCAFDFGNTPRRHHGEYFMRDVEDLRRLPGVLEAAPAVWKRGVKMTYRKNNFLASLGGIGPSFFEALFLPISSGRRIVASDVDELRSVCIVGQTVEKELFGTPGFSLGKKIQIMGHSFRVVGVLGGAEDATYMETVFIPISVAKSRFIGMDRIRDIYVRAIDWDSVPALHSRAQELLTSNQPGYAESMQVTYFADRIDAIKTIVFIFKFFLYAAISVTIILGGLGITNVMLAVVNERTTEIGLRKAVGATESMIMAQFLCESLTVSLAGACIGIVCGFWAVELLQKVFETEAGTRVLIFSILGSVILGVVLGVASGMLPAARASRLSAVEAMRFE